MPYQPDYAVPHTTIQAKNLNAQFAAIKAQFDAQAAQITALQTENQSLTQQLTDRAEFNEKRDKVNEVLSGLKHPA